MQVKATVRYHFIPVRLVKAMVFPVVMYGCESWTVNHEVSGNDPTIKTMTSCSRAPFRLPLKTEDCPFTYQRLKSPSSVLWTPSLLAPLDMFFLCFTSKQAHFGAGTHLKNKSFLTACSPHGPTHPWFHFKIKVVQACASLLLHPYFTFQPTFS